MADLRTPLIFPAIRRALIAMVAFAIAAVTFSFSIGPAGAATFTVTNANGTGPGSLGQAISDVNAACGSGPHTIDFQILNSDPNWDPVRGVYTIHSPSLPDLTCPGTNIDGRTQEIWTVAVAGPWQLNSGDGSGMIGSGGVVGTDGIPGLRINAPEIEIVGTRLVIAATDVTIAGLAFHGNASPDLEVLATAHRATITENVFGATAEYGVPATLSQDGVAVTGGDDGALSSNIIAHHTDFGVSMSGGSTGWVIQGNEIRANSTTSLKRDGVFLDGAYPITISENLIADNWAMGMEMGAGVGGALVENNTITGNGFGGTETMGVAISTNDVVFRKNVAANNVGAGVMVDKSAVNNTFSQNSMYGNGTVPDNTGTTWHEIGIDLLASGDDALTGGDGDAVPPHSYVTVNDDGDADSQGNLNLNFPVIDTAAIAGPTLTVSGWSPAGATIEVFVAAPDPEGFGEGQTYLFSVVEGSVSDTDPSTGSYGAAMAPVNGVYQGTESNVPRFEVAVAMSSLPVALTGSELLTATGTVGLATSEFSGVTPVNGSPNHPYFSPETSDQSTPVGGVASLSLSALDPQGDPLTFSATGLPTGLTIDPDTGTITGVVTAPGFFSVSVTVDDGNGNTATDAFNWTVVDGFYLVADTGGSHGGGDDLLTVADPADPSTTTNETNVGGGTGTTAIKGSAVHPTSGVIYAVSGDSLGTIDPATGVWNSTFPPIGSSANHDSGVGGTITVDAVVGMAFDNAGNLYAVQRVSGFEDVLLRIDPVTGLFVPNAFAASRDFRAILEQGARRDVEAIAVHPGTGVMYGSMYDGGTNHRFVSIDTFNGDTVDLGKLDPIQVGGMAFDASGTLYAVGHDKNTPLTQVIYEVAGDGAATALTVVDNGAGYQSMTRRLPPPPGVFGTIFEDVAGDALAGSQSIGDTANPGVSGAAVYLYDDSGAVAGSPDATDALVTGITNPATTSSTGEYSFVGVPNGTYYVVVDSASIDPNAAFNGGYASGSALSEQTWGPDQRGLRGAPYVWIGGDGNHYGGAEEDVADSLASAGAAEHIARISFAGTSVVDVDFGFSFNVVTTTDGGIGASRIQGSLDQFIQNANAMAGANAARFVPTSAATGSGPSGTWWEITPSSSFTSVNDADTSIDGTAYSAIDGSVVDSNGGFLGVNANGDVAVGADSVALPQVPRPELHLVGTQLVAGPNGGLVPHNLLLRRFAITTVGGVDALQLSDADGLVVEHAVIGSGPDEFSSTLPSGLDRGIELDNTNGGTIRDSLIGFADGRAIQLLGTTGVSITGNELRTTSSDVVDIADTGSGNLVEANLLVGGGDYGIDVFGANHTIRNNTLDGNGVTPGQQGGIRLTSQGALVDRNVITNNQGPGILVAGIWQDNPRPPTQGNELTKNVTTGNAGLGIDLVQTTTAGTIALRETGDGVTPNDGTTTPDHGNEALDHPVITSAVITGSTITVAATLPAGAKIEFYAVDPDPTGHGEAKDYLAFFTDNQGSDADPLAGQVQVAFPTATGITSTDQITAIATLVSSIPGKNNTSEYGPNLDVESTPVVNDQTLTPAIAEDSADAAVVGTVTASDADLHAVTYAIVGGDPTGIFTIGTNSGQVSINVPPGLDYEAATSHDITVEVTDPTGLKDTGVVTINVANVNEQPTLDLVSDQSVDERSLLSFTATGSDPDAGDSLSFSVGDGTDPVPPGAAITVGGGFTWTPTEAQGPGTYSFKIRVTDALGLFDEQEFTITVAETSEPPNVTNPGNQSSAEDDTISLGIVADDSNDVPQNNIVSYSASGLPMGLSINPTTGLISGTIAFGADAGSPYSVTVTVTDDGAAPNSAQVTFQWTVGNTNRLPTATDDGTYAVLEGGVLNVAAPGVLGNDTDPDGDTLTASLDTPATKGTAVVNNDGSFTFTASGDNNGADSFVYRVDDGNLGTDTATVTLSITPVNDAPSFTKGADEVVLEDAVAQSVPGWATGISAGPADESGQTLTFNVSNDNNGLFAVQPVVGSTGELTYAPAASANGVATVTVSLSDDGGTLNGGVDTSGDQTFTITVTAVNDAPSFTKGADEVVLEDAVAQSVPGWATAISAGPADESGQTLTFNVSNDNNGLFAVQPAVSPIGELTYMPAGDANGVATVTVSLSDDGGTLNGGVDTSANQTFTITVTAVNDAPSFTKGADESVLEDAGARSVPGWATGISAGPADEAGQTVTFTVSNDNNGLFAVQPAVSSTGELTYTPAANANGVATVTVSLSDDGGTLNGGVDTSANQTFTITVTAVNDVPSFTKGADQSDLEAPTSVTVNNWATGISTGPPDESGQIPSFTVVNDNNALFSFQPTVNSSGTLIYTLDGDANGAATVTVSLSDDGGTLNGGVDTSANQTFTITVTAVNDAPSFTIGPDVTVLEDAGPQTRAGHTVGMSPGPVDEAGQTITFSVSNDNNALFAAQPDIDEVSGDLTFTPAANANGVATVTVSLSDDGGTLNGGVDTSGDQTFTITVDPDNDPPTLDPVTDYTIDELAALVFTATASDPDTADTLTFSLVDGTNPVPGGATITNTGDFSWTPAESQGPGTYSFKVRVTDSGAAIDEQEFTVTVDEVNVNPVLTPPANQVTAEGSAVSLTVVASDADIPVNYLAFSATGLPPGLSINPATGVITGAPSFGASDSSPYLVNVTVSDGTGSDGAVFTWTISDSGDGLIITKSASPAGSVLPGSNIAYTITVANVDSVDHTGVEVVDPVPAGTTWVSTDIVTPSPSYALDTFDTITYAGDEGTVPWAGPWAESGDGTGTPETTGEIFVGDDHTTTARNALSITGPTAEISRAIDLSGVTWASLTFDFLAWDVDQAHEQVFVEIWDGSAWNLVDTITQLPKTTTTYQSWPPAISTTFSGDLTPYAGPDTRIRFSADGLQVGTDGVDIKNVRIDYSTPSAPAPGGPGPVLVSGQTLRPGEQIVITYVVQVDDPVTVASVDNTAETFSDLQGSVFASTSNGLQNRAPIVNAGIDQTVDEGDTVTIAPVFVDNDYMEAHTATIDWGDGSAIETIDPAVSPLASTHVYTDNGVFTVTITVEDKYGATGSDALTVTAQNAAPVVVAGADQTVDEGATVALGTTFSDPGAGDTHTATIDWGDGTPSEPGTVGPGTIGGSHAYADNGTYTVTVTVTDDDGASTTDTFTVTVNNASPVVTAGPNDTVPEGGVVSIAPTFTDAGTADTHTASIDWGDGSPADTVDPAVSPLSASHTYADDGVYTVTVTVTDDDGGSDSDVLSMTVSNETPVVTPAPDQTGIEGSAISLTVATFTDAGPVDTHSATVDWGDGSPAEPGVVAGGDVTATHAYVDNGVFSVTVTVADDDGGTASASFTTTVSNVAPVVDAGPDRPGAAGIAVSLDPATFVDPGTADVFSATIDWGDGSPLQPGLVGPGTVDGSHVYATSGIYVVTVTVDDGDDSGSDTMTVSVGNTSPVVVADPDQAGAEGDLIAVSATFIDPDAADTHTATIDWGDGTPVDSIGAVTNVVTGSHVYSDNGSYVVTIEVTDSAMSTGNDTMTITVSNVDPLTNAGPDVVGAEGDSIPLSATFTDPGSADTHDASVDWGDGSVLSTYSGVTSPITDAHTYADEGNYTVTVTTTDDDGGTGADTVTVTLTNVAPTVTSTTPQAVAEGTLLSLNVANYTDPGTADTHSATIDWGDGNSDAIAVSGGSVAGSHVYADNANYTVTVTVEDDDGASGADAFVVVVSNVAPTVEAGLDRSIVDGSPLSLTAIASDAGADDTLVASVDWGDGSVEALPVVAGLVTGSHLYADAGIYPVFVTVTDDDGSTGADSFTVMVDNAAPTLLPIPVIDGAELTVISFASSATDTPGSTLTYSMIGAPDGASIDPVTGEFAWTPSEAQGPATHQFTIVVSDHHGATAEQTVTIDVAEVNSPPQVVVEDVAISEGERLTVVVEAEDADLPANSLTHLAAGLPSGLSVDPLSGVISGDVGYELSGDYEVTVTVSDGGSETSVTFTLTVANTNRPPVANPDTLTVGPGSSESFVLSGSDPDGDPITYTIVEGPKLGTLTGDAPNLTYSGNGNGVDTITFIVNDGQADSEPATITIEVTSNRTPVGAADRYAVDELRQLDIAAPGVLANDGDPDGDTLTVSIVRRPTNGTVALSPDGGFRYEHRGGGDDSFRYVLDDGLAVSDPITVSISVNPNRPPIAEDDSFVIDEDTTLEFSVLDNDSDPDGDVIAFDRIDRPRNGQLVSDGSGTMTFTPDGDWYGTVQLGYRIRDERGAVGQGNVRIVVAPVNDAPSANNVGGSVSEEELSLEIELDGDIGDIDGDALTISLGAPAHGVAVLSGRYGVRYTPDPGFNGTDSFTYKVNDGNGAVTEGVITVAVKSLTASDIAVELVSFERPKSVVATIEERGGVGALLGVRLIVGSVFETFDVFRLPLLALLGAFLFSLILGLSRGFVFGAGPVFLPVIAPQAYAVVLRSAGDQLEVRAEPGIRTGVIGSLEPTARDLRSTGRRAQVGRSLWIEIETDDGDGWVESRFVTTQVAPGLFASDDRAMDLVSDLDGIISAKGDLSALAPDGLYVAHFSAPEYLDPTATHGALSDATIWGWWDRSGSIPDLDGTFYDMIGEPLGEAIRRHEAIPNAPTDVVIPTEFENFNRMVIGDAGGHSHDAWHLFYRYDDERRLQLVGIWREGLANPNASGAAHARRLLAAG